MLNNKLLEMFSLDRLIFVFVFISQFFDFCKLYPLQISRICLRHNYLWVLNSTYVSNMKLLWVSQKIENKNKIMTIQTRPLRGGDLSMGAVWAPRGRKPKGA
jgi:hypothetical protein